MKLYETLILKGWWAILLAMAIGAVLLGTYVPNVVVDAGTSALLNEDDPDLAFYESTRPLWGYDEYATLCLTRDDWLTPAGLEILGTIVKELEAVEEIDHVTSILDIPLLRQEPGPMINPSKVPFLSSADLDLEAARKEILGHTQALGNLISEDGRSLSLLAYLGVPPYVLEMNELWSKLKVRSIRGDAEAAAEMERLRPEKEAASDVRSARRLALVAAVRKTAARWEPRMEEPISLSGTSIVNANLVEHLQHDLVVFGIAAFLLFVLAFTVVYRKVRFIAFPIISCVLPVIFVLGGMYLLDMSLTVITANLPVLLFTLMLPYTVYFVERYRERRAMFPEEPGATSTFEAARSVWVPCLFSCLTTMAGFTALLTSRTRPVHDFGLMMAAGMGIGLVVVFLAIPSMTRPLSGLVVTGAGVRREPGRLVRLFERLTLARPGVVIACSAVLLGMAIWGATRLSAQSKIPDYFKPNSEVYLGMEYVDTRMGGTTPLEVLLESDQPNYFLKPDGLKALAAVQAYFDTVPETGNVRSLETLVEELKKKNPNIVMLLPMFARVPVVRSATKDFANEDYSVARVIVRMRETAPTLDRNVILEGLEKHLRAQPELQGLKEVRVTGIFLLYANMLNTLMETQKKTFLYVVLAIFLMLIVLFRSAILALLVLSTQVLPAIVMLGVMGWSRVPLDLVTVMIASIAMGVGIDAAIQYTFRYRAELAVDGDRRAAVSRAHATIGRAIWIATSVIIAGFCVLTLSEFKPSIYLGLFTAVAMLMSQLAALTILPSIFLLTGYPRLKARG